MKGSADSGRQLLGEEHPDTLTSMANVASTYWNQGRRKEAEGLIVLMIATMKRVLGEENAIYVRTVTVISKLTCGARPALRQPRSIASVVIVLALALVYILV